MTIAPAPTPEAPRRQGERLNNTLEWVGYALIVAFAGSFGVRWGLLAAGVILVVTSALRDAAARPKKPAKVPFVERVIKALSAYRGGT